RSAARSQNVLESEQPTPVARRIRFHAKPTQERQRRLCVLAGEGIRGAHCLETRVPEVEFMDLPRPPRSELAEFPELASEVVDQLGWQGPRKACHMFDAGSYFRQKPAEARIDTRWLG